MKKLRTRANGAMLLVLLVLAGLGLFVFRIFAHGGDWALLPANSEVFSSGTLDRGTVTDRDGVMLASAGGGVYRYAEDSAVREASLHLTGDYGGNIGTGALSYFARELIGYSPLTGVYSRDGKGGTVKLTVSASVNVAAYNALAGRRGAVLVMDYESGEVLCMVSSPSYDPVYQPDLSQPMYEGVFINRAVSSVYTPGSVFKTVTLCAAIENIPNLFEREFSCPGSVEIDGDTVTCSGVHGTQDIYQAFANSCNAAFARLSVELGADVLARYANALGLTSASGLSGIPSAAGSFPEDADGSDLAWAGIGQADDLVSPFAMLRVMAAIASGGLLTEPSIVSGRFLQGGGSVRLIGENTADTLREMLLYNIENVYGAGVFPGLTAGGKTGTAEVGGGKSPHAWFTGFTGGETHLAVVVVIENGGGGLVSAAPVANAVLQAAAGITGND